MSVLQSSIRLHDLDFIPFITEQEISAIIDKMAAQLNQEFKDETPVFIAVLNGSFMFVSEILKRYEYDCEINFIKFKSYEGTTSSGNVQQVLGLDQSVVGRSVIILEDIVDTGNTLEALLGILGTAGCKDLKVASLFMKPDAYKKQYEIDYIGIEIPDRFIVGYGLDYEGLGRNLTTVYQLKPTQMTNLVLFGPPGAGKGTQAQIIKDTYDLVHISTGDVFRYNMKHATALGTLAKSFIDKGQLVPDKVTIDMLNAEVEKNPKAKGFIFDGFPRTAAQADALASLLQAKGVEVSAMIALEVDDEVLVQRLLERGKTSGRPDDADESIIRNRIKVYYEETAILKEYYQKQNKYYGIDGVGAIDEITSRLNAVIDTL